MIGPSKFMYAWAAAGRRGGSGRTAGRALGQWLSGLVELVGPAPFVPSVEDDVDVLVRRVDLVADHQVAVGTARDLRS